MSETTTNTDRDQRTGRFLAGNNGGGRKPGARSKLSTQFVEDLRDCWGKHGISALERCAIEEPGMFVRTVAGLLPRDVRIDVAIDVGEFASNFRQALQLLGNEPDLPRRKAMKVIGAD
jgi:hypothetical protein